MADSINDINLVANVWNDIYTLSSIVVGTSIIIQNKTSDDILLWISASQPAAAFNQGVVLRPLSLDPQPFYLLDAGESGLWIKGEGPIQVQEA